MNVVILQSNYIPWRGYFDLIHDADIFVFHDDLQYTKDDWRNRNKIKVKNEASWLTIPVGKSEKRLICEVELPKNKWVQHHLHIFRGEYRQAPHGEWCCQWFSNILLSKNWTKLSELNQEIIKQISRDILGIQTKFLDSREFELTKTKQERVLELLKKIGATRYISGPAAKAYLDEKRFKDEGIDLIWKDYGGYPEYPQNGQPFLPNLSILDLMANTGTEAPYYIWGWRKK